MKGYNYCLSTINSLNNIRLALANKITALENQDEWVANEEIARKLEECKETKELVNLIIGYKRFKMEAEEESQKKANLKNHLKTRLKRLKQNSQVLKIQSHFK